MVLSKKFIYADQPDQPTDQKFKKLDNFGDTVYFRSNEITSNEICSGLNTNESSQGSHPSIDIF